MAMDVTEGNTRDVFDIHSCLAEKLLRKNSQNSEKKARGLYFYKKCKLQSCYFFNYFFVERLNYFLSTRCLSQQTLWFLEF